MAFRAITSTNGEVCLFPETIPSKLCKKIGFIFGEKLSFSETDTRAPSQMSTSPSPFNNPSSSNNLNFNNLLPEPPRSPHKQSNIVRPYTPSFKLSKC